MQKCQMFLWNAGGLFSHARKQNVALGISSGIQTTRDGLLKTAICRCLPVTGCPLLDCTVNTGKRQAGFHTRVGLSLENMLDGYMGDIFGSSRRGAGDL